MLRNVIRTSMRRAAQVPATRLSIPKSTSSYPHPTCRSYTLLSRRVLPLASTRQLRWSSASAGLNRTEVEGRIMDLLKNFDRVMNFLCETSRILAEFDVIQVTDSTKVNINMTRWRLLRSRWTDHTNLKLFKGSWP